MFSEYQSYVACEFNENYWSDEGISHASQLLETFSEEDWRQLQGAWRVMPGVWQVRCAESIETPSQFAQAILIDMLAEPDPSLVVAAADSLRNMSGPMPPLSADTIRRIRALCDASGPVIKRALGAFLQKIGS